MALSNLNELTKKQYDDLKKNPFADNPKLTKGSDVDPNVSISPYGWVGNDVFVFTVTTKKDHESAVKLGGFPVTILVVDVKEIAGAPISVTYWTVKTGLFNEKDDKWKVVYRIDREKKPRKTGKWVFDKGADVVGNLLIWLISFVIELVVGIWQALVRTLK